MNDLEPKMGTGAMASADREWDEEAFVEQIWNDLDGMVTRSAIRQVLTEIIPRYESAHVQTFVPIFVRKEAVERLRSGLAEVPPDRHVQ
jgi:hypothetical protein